MLIALFPFDSTNLDAQAHAANLLDEQGERAGALAEFDRILAGNPQHIPAHIGKGAVSPGTRPVPTARSRNSTARSPSLPNTMQVDALVARGITLALKGRFKEANANVERALDLGPDHAKALVGKGVLLTSKQLDRAITVLGRSIGDGNEDPMVFVLRGKALAQSGALDRALADFDQALKLRAAQCRGVDGSAGRSG